MSISFSNFYLFLIITLYLLSQIVSVRKAKMNINMIASSKSQKMGFKFNKFHMNTHMFSKYYTKQVQNPNTLNNTNDTLRASLYRDLNRTFVVQGSEEFRRTNRKWDYKVLDKQLEEIFSTLLFRNEGRMTTNGVRNYMEIFMNEYTSCDNNKDNVLSLTEFTACMKSDPYLIKISPPPSAYALHDNFTDPEVFYKAIFDVLDERFENYINFVGYMRMRLMAYSWRECSILAPYLEEVDFECAIEIIAKTKTITRTTSRNLFKIALDLSNNSNSRNLDFISYFIIANSVRLYGMINGKEDNDISRSEINLALDDNLLPIRFNQEIIDQLFHLLDDYDKPNQGIDIESFVYYDFILQFFAFPKKQRPYYLNSQDFNTVITNPFFPNKTLNEIFFIPQYNLTSDSYQMYEYLNISRFITEGDYLYKFLEFDSEIKSENLKNSKISNLNMNYPINPLDPNKTKNLLNTTFSLQNTLNLIFKTLDSDLDNWINFYEFGSMMQIAFIFCRADKYNKGKIPAAILYDVFKNYADFPTISYRLREKAEKFNLFDQNLYIDLLSTIQILKIDDIANYFKRKFDTTSLNEIELKKIMTMINMRYVPDTYLERCLRGIDSNNIPRYDWECSFVEGMKLNLNYFEAMNNYKEVQINNLTLLNTVFYNVDPNYQ